MRIVLLSVSQPIRLSDQTLSLRRTTGSPRIADLARVRVLGAEKRKVGFRDEIGFHSPTIFSLISWSNIVKPYVRVVSDFRRS